MTATNGRIMAAVSGIPGLSDGARAQLYAAIMEGGRPDWIAVAGFTVAPGVTLREAVRKVRPEIKRRHLHLYPGALAIIEALEAVQNGENA